MESGSDEQIAKVRAAQVNHKDGQEIPTVLHVISGFGVGGAQRLIVILAEYLSAQGQPVPQVLSLTHWASVLSDRVTGAGGRLRYISATSLWNPLAWWRAWRAISESGAEVLHLHLSGGIIFGTIIGRLQRKVTIATLHNVRSQSKSTPRARMRQAMETFCLRHLTDHVILVSAEVAAANAARLGKVAQTVLQNVTSPIPSLHPDRRKEVRAGLGVAADAVLLISTGRLIPQKDLAMLLSAFAELVAQGVKAHLLIVGTGQDQVKLEEKARALGLGRNVTFLGARGDIAELLGASDIFVLSSIWEGIPVGLLEAMSAGLPVVATAVGGVPEVVGKGGGTLVAARDADGFANALATYCRDPVLRQQTGLAARHAVAGFTDVADWVSRTQAIYLASMRGRG